MASEENETQSVGVFLPDGEGKPVAVFANEEKAALFARSMGKQAIIAPAKSFKQDSDVAAVFESRSSANEAVPNTAAIDVRRSQVAGTLRREILTEELRKAVKSDVEDSAKETVKLTEEQQKEADARAKAEAEKRQR